MEITGKLIRILEDVRGESAKGPWVRGGFVIETEGEWPRQVAFTAFGEDRVALAKSIPLMSLVTVNFSPESREFNGRWYTDLRCSRIQQAMMGNQMYQTPMAGQMPTASTGYNYATQPAAPQQPTAAFASQPNPDEDLPF